MDRSGFGIVGPKPTDLKGQLPMEAPGMVLGRFPRELPAGAKGFLEGFLEQQCASLLQHRNRAW